MKRLQSPFWLAIIFSCIAETILRIVGQQVGDVGPDGQGNTVAFVLLFLHFPAILLTSLVIRDPFGKLFFPVEVTANLVVFALVFWGALAGLKWYVERD